MPEPRKIFRIEERAASRLGEQNANAQAPLRHAELMQEIAALRAMLAAMASPPSPRSDGAPHHGATARLTSELTLISGAIGGESARPHAAGPDATVPPMTRIAHELEEVVDSTERATQKVLAAAEEIDQVANNLVAALNGKFEQGLAKDIQDLVIRIFEACNFQDLAGQRIGKVIKTLDMVEQRMTAAVARCKGAQAPAAAAAVAPAGALLNGPRLDGEGGHASQRDVDQMFG